MKKLISLILVAIFAIATITACTPAKQENSFTVGICNYVDDASLNQIVANIKDQLNKTATEKNVKIEIIEKNCNADSNVLNQIITDFISRKVDLMVGVATPVAIAMQSATEDNKIPVVFAAVSDPLGVALVDHLFAFPFS